MKFDEKTHEYTRQGSVYTSATQLLKKYGLSVDYGTIPPAVLAKAAQKGNAVHKALELYIDGDKNMIGLSNEVKQFDKYITDRGINLSLAKAEEMLYDDNYKIAGTIDFQYLDGKDMYVADFKTTSSLHLDAVAWQLSIYNYLACQGDIMQYYFNKLKVFHFTNNRMYVKDVYTVDYDNIVNLFKTNKNNEPTFTYTKSTNVVSKTDEKFLNSIVDEIEAAKNVVDSLIEERDKVLNKIKKKMVKQKDYKFYNDKYSISYIEGRKQYRLNNSVVEEYLKRQQVNMDDFFNEIDIKDSIRISLRKSKD